MPSPGSTGRAVGHSGRQPAAALRPLCVSPPPRSRRRAAEKPAPYVVVKAAAGHGLGPKATPVYADGKVFTFGISGILTALDAKTFEVPEGYKKVQDLAAEQVKDMFDGANMEELVKKLQGLEGTGQDAAPPSGKQ